MGNRLSDVRPNGMWKLVFFSRRGLRVEVDRSGPWLPSRSAAEAWAQFFLQAGHHVGLQSQDGRLERLSAGLPA